MLNFRPMTCGFIKALNIVQRSSQKTRCLSTSNPLLQHDSEGIKISNIGKHIAHIELDKPKKKNAFSLNIGKKFINILQDLEDNPNVRCSIISGSGSDLTAGVDLNDFMGLYAKLQDMTDHGRRAKLLLKFINQFQAPFKALYEFPKPIICVMHGLCYGLAMELAACSDIRYCSPDVKMSIREVLIGIAADVGSLQEMPRSVANQSLLRELIYTGRDLTIDEIKELGFVSRVCNSKPHAIEAAIETAGIIASRSPVAVQGSKRNIKFSRDKPYEIGMDFNAVWNMSMLQSEDVTKAVQAIIQRDDKVEFEDY